MHGECLRLPDRGLPRASTRVEAAYPKINHRNAQSVERYAETPRATVAARAALPEEPAAMNAPGQP